MILSPSESVALHCCPWATEAADDSVQSFEIILRYTVARGFETQPDLSIHFILFLFFFVVVVLGARRLAFV